jgi:hypothetical protein
VTARRRGIEIRLREGGGLRTWRTAAPAGPVAAPPAKVAELLGVNVEQVLHAGVEPYTANDGRQLWSVRLVGIELGLLRPSLRDADRKRRRREELRRAAAS